MDRRPTYLRLVWTALTGVTLLLGACSEPAKPPQAISVDSLFQVTLPPYLQPVEGLHAFAPLQFGSDEEGMFVLGLPEPKEALRNIHLTYTLEDYEHVVLGNVKLRFDSVRVRSRDTLVQNGMEMIRTDFSGMIRKKPLPVTVYYKLAVFESQAHFIQLACWAFQQDYEKLKGDMEAIITSFTPVASVLGQQEPAASEP